ncbi:MAG: transposase, partial [Coriobacteriaceae bacterium]
RRCPNARWVMDPFHVVEWINDALERVRRDEWQAALMATRQADRQARAAKAQGAQPLGGGLSHQGEQLCAREEPPEDLSARQRERLLELKRAEGHLARAWTLKEDLEGYLPCKGCA